MKNELTKVLIALAVVTVLASVALTSAQPYSSMREEVNTEDYEECEELMEHMHEECTETINGMHHSYHSHHNTQTHNETTESYGRHGCH